MNKTEILTNLVEVRKDALEQNVHGTLRPHGKMWSMDVFSWDNPSVEGFASTVHSFPFPLVWLAPASFAKAVLTFDLTVLTNVHALVVIGDTTNEVKKLAQHEVLNFIQVDDFTEGLEWLQGYKLRSGVIMINMISPDVESSFKALNDFLAIHQL